MAEQVQTGGIMQFKYEKGNNPKLNEKQKKEIEDAYQQADERKRKEKIRKKIKTLIIVILIILFIIALYFVVKALVTKPFWF